jgi:hypothetical protein
MRPRHIVGVLVQVLSRWPLSDDVFPSNLSPRALRFPRVIRLFHLGVPGLDSARPVLGSAYALSP